MHVDMQACRRTSPGFVPLFSAKGSEISALLSVGFWFFFFELKVCSSCQRCGGCLVSVRSAGVSWFVLLLFSLFLWVFGVTCSLSRGWTWPSQACFVQEAPRRKRLLHCCPNVWVVPAVRREFYSRVPQLNESFSRQRDVLLLLLFAGGGAAGSKGLK